MNNKPSALLLTLAIALLCPLTSCKKQADRPQTTRIPFDARIDGIAVRPLKNIDTHLAQRILSGDQQVPPLGADEVAVAAPEPTRPAGPSGPAMGPAPAAPFPTPAPPAAQPTGGYSFDEDANDLY